MLLKLIWILGLITILPAFGDTQIREDSGLVVEEFVRGIPDSPTTMAFVGNDILILTKYDGQVLLVKNGVLQEDPVLDVAVNSDGERGMLGITAIGESVYLYFTESDKDGGKALANRIYRYDWDGAKLVNPVLLRTLPGDNLYHNGGAMTSFDGKVYAVIGDNGNYGRLQNKIETAKNDTSVILRVDPDGPYYAIGVRNSFGLVFDPQTGNLWDTENGDDDFDEINLVPENFNSGWISIMGPATQAAVDALPRYGNYVYSDPEFSWQKPIAPTGISFSKSDTFGHKDRVFVGDCNNGNLYWFKLNQTRTGFVFESPHLADNVLNTDEPSDEILLGTGFGCMTDVEEGPDGYLYIVSLSEGKIFRILPRALAETNIQDSNAEQGGCLIATAAYGTELAPQVQHLREIRQNTLLATNSGVVFLSAFNDVYYSFSPAVADLERHNAVFKELIKVTITPILSTLLLLDYVDINSEHEMVGFGMVIILLNVGMYFVLPVFAIIQVKRRFIT